MKAWARLLAVLIKELIQMRRDRMTFAMMLGIPVMQLILFGYAINLDPKQLPTAIYVEEQTPITRRLVHAFQQSGYYDIQQQVYQFQQIDDLLASGEISFALVIQQGFTQKFIKGLKPQLLVEADASDPAAASNAIAKAKLIITQALKHELTGSLAYLQPTADPVDVVVHSRYNPEAITQYNIVPGLLGVILTMTSVMFTSMAMTRESEQGNLENLLAMPIKPVEMMLGKIIPYVLVGAVQTGVILTAARFLFDVPFVGELTTLLSGVLLFIIANLALGFTFSTIARTQMQAMQMTFFFFLPSILLSGFMFPFRGMPDWAQTIGEALPLTHFLRIVRGVMLKGAELKLLLPEFYALLIFCVVVSLIAMFRYRRTLD
jgi:ABC-2 type transport system permease protein